MVSKTKLSTALISGILQEGGRAYPVIRYDITTSFTHYAVN